MTRSSIPKITTGCLLFLLLLFPQQLSAEVRLPRVIGSGMVLQQQMEISIWGWANPAEKVTVEINGQCVKNQADRYGKWSIKLDAMETGGPYEMIVRAENEIVLEDILIGDVWICSGQSNMQMGLGAVKDGERHVRQANYPKMRLFMVPDYRTSGIPLDDLHAGQWKVCTPENVSDGKWGGFSAVGYFFGKEIHKKLNVPVGIIDISKGGTSIRTWTNPKAYAKVDALKHYLGGIEKANQEYREKVGVCLSEYKQWIVEAQSAWDDGRQVPLPPEWPEHPRQDRKYHGSLYNAMVHPIVLFGIRGALWYQGEANVWGNDGMMYYERMKALIGGWRDAWGQGDFPLYYVQVSPYFYSRRDPNIVIDSDCLPRLWEGQRAALQIANTGMTVTNDLVDNLEEIHPAEKEQVGKRLSLWALSQTYNIRDIVYSGPLYRSMVIEGNTVRIFFDHTGSGLVTRDGKVLDGFEIAGADGNFVKADAMIDGDTVVVSNEQIAEPKVIRFAWHCEAQPNLMNKEGLPAAAFRTDKWWNDDY